MSASPMKLLLTGANGQVGSAIRRLAVRYGFLLRAYDSAELDITNAAALEAVIHAEHPDLLINAAAYTAVDKAEADAVRAFAVNAEAVGVMARICKARDIPLIHVSTDYVFDGSKSRPYLESDPVGPLGVYGRSKLAGEEAVLASGARYIILRTSWVFGLEGHNFPKTILRLAGERPTLGIVSDQRGCPTFADDIASAILALAALYEGKSDIAWGIYHYAGDTACSWYEFAGLLLQKARAANLLARMPALKALTTSEYPTPATRPMNSCLDCSRFRQAFPDIPLSNWDKGLDILLRNKN